MPEKGGAILTVREDTAIRVKEEAHGMGLTIDEFINHLMDPDIKEEWSVCGICGAKVKSRNLHRHIVKTHPKSAAKLTSQKHDTDGN